MPVSTAIASGNDITLAGPITLNNSGVSTITVTSPYVTATISGVISGTGSSGFGKAGPGFMVLAAPTYTDATNSWTGPTAVNGGFLKLGYQGALPATSGQLQIGGGGVLDLNGFSATVASLADGLAGGGGVVNNHATSAVVFTAGSDNATTTFSGALFANTATANNLAFTKKGSGALTLTGDNSYAGLTRVEGGMLDVTLSATLPHLPSLPTNSGLVISGGAVVQTSGTLARNVVQSPVAGIGTVTWQEGGGGFAARGNDLTVNLASGGLMTWDSNGFVNDEDPLVFGSSTADHTVIWQNPIQLNGLTAQTREIRVNAGTGAAPEAVLQNVLSQGTAVAGLNKTGSGTLKLNAANIYTGSTDILEGKLVVNNSILSNATSAVTTVHSGATLAGTGTISGPVVVNSLGQVAPGDGTMAMLSTGNFTINSGGILDYLFGASNSSSMIAVGGLLTLPTDSGSITLNSSGLTSQDGTYKLFTYGSISTTASDLTSLFTFTQPAGTDYHIVSVAGEGTSGEVDLQISLAPTRTEGIWDKKTDASNTWFTQENWKDRKKPGNNLGDTATFGDVILNNMEVTMDGNRQLGVLTINSTSYSYTIAQGTGSGTLSLVSTGTTATVTVQGGHQQTISAPIDLGSNVLFTVDPSTALAVSGRITESVAGKSLTKAGSGILSLSGSNAYTGVTTINGGVLEATSLVDGGVESSIGSSAKGETNLVINGATLRYTGATTTSTDRLFTLGIGGGTLDVSGLGSVTFSNTGSLALASSGTRTLTLTGSNAGANTLAAGIGDDDVNATSVTKSGSGTWVLSGTSSYSGPTMVSEGILSVNGVLQNSNVTVQSGATLSGTGTVSKNAIVTGGTIDFGSAGGITGNLDIDNGAAWNGLGNVVGLVRVNTGTLSVAGSLTTSAVNVLGDSDLAGSGTITGSVDYTSSASSTFGGTIAGSSSSVRLDNALAVLTLSGVNSYAGGTSVSAGTLKVGNAAALGGSGNGGLAMSGSSTVDMNGQSIPFANALTSLSGGTNNVITNAGVAPVTLAVKNTATSTYSGTIRRGTADIALSKYGTGTLVLLGNNGLANSGFGGGVTVGDGVVQLGHNNALGTGGLTMGDPAHSPASMPTVEMNGFHPTVTSLDGSTGTITNHAGGDASTLTVKVAVGPPSTYTGAIAGNSALVKDGLGELALGGVNDYTGSTTVKNGTLTINSLDALPSTTKLNINGDTDATVVIADDLGAIELSGLDLGGLGVASSSPSVAGGGSPVAQMAASTVPTGASSLTTGVTPAAQAASRVSSGGTAAVPEPGTIALLLAGAAIGLVALLRRRNRRS